MFKFKQGGQIALPKKADHDSGLRRHAATDTRACPWVVSNSQGGPMRIATGAIAHAVALAHEGQEMHAKT